MTTAAARPTIYDVAADPEVKAALSKYAHVAPVVAKPQVNRCLIRSYAVVRKGKLIEGQRARDAMMAELRTRVKRLELRAESLRAKSVEIDADVAGIRKAMEELE